MHGMFCSQLRGETSLKQANFIESAAQDYIPLIVLIPQMFKLVHVGHMLF